MTRKLKTKAAAAVGLVGATTLGVLNALEADGLIRASSAGRTIVYTVTEAGSARLGAAGDSLRPVRGRIIPPTDDRIRRFRADFLLLQVLRADEQGLTETDANKQLDRYARDGLELNVATASHVRRDLVAQGLLANSGSRVARYTLTPAGQLAVGNTEFPDDNRRKFSLTGRTLNQLLEAAREVGKQFTTGNQAPPPRPTEQNIERVILASFEDLLREHHHVTRLVPIHEVRDRVRQALGDTAARYDVFDSVLLRLRHNGGFRLVSISNPRDATPDQLQASVPGLGETLFYMEATGAPVAR